MLVHFPKTLKEREGLRNPQKSAQLFGMDRGPHNGVGPGGVGKAEVRLSRLRQRQTVPLKSPATKSMS